MKKTWIVLIVVAVLILMVATRLSAGAMKW